ncbi:hypothetical protein [Ferruginibacter sp.]|uniref:hypothetical protein n=1 Tax=Ferruginibacter sp. TaxID=1940288 RepID=UPI00265A3397|nr:hypothetical protein [Ferruginibacter sp.]
MNKDFFIEEVANGILYKFSFRESFRMRQITVTNIAWMLIAVFFANHFLQKSIAVNFKTR